MGKKGLEPPRGYDEIGFQGGSFSASNLRQASGEPIHGEELIFG